MSETQPLPEDCFALPPGTHWTPVAEALETLRQQVRPVTGVEDIPLDQAVGRISAGPVCASWDVPRSANAAVDGYAFAAKSLEPGEPLRIAEGRAAAGHPWAGQLGAGEAVRILTGAPMPFGADTVEMQERVEIEDGSLRISKPPPQGANTRAAGEDLGAGEVTVEEDIPLRPQDLAQAASGGAATMRVYRPLRVGLLSTGDELRQPGVALQPHEVADANRPMLQGMLSKPFFETMDLDIAEDRESALRKTLERACERCDALVVSGGASGGDEDHLARILSQEGRIDVWRIAVKPGRPLVMAHLDGIPVIGLPGNPVAAFVCGLLFARPVLLRMAGAKWPEPRRFSVPLAASLQKKPGRNEYLRARIENRRRWLCRKVSLHRVGADHRAAVV